MAMTPPTPDELRAISRLLEEKLPEDEPNDQWLDAAIAVESAYVGETTGRAILEGMPGLGVPDWMRPLVVRIIALRIERSVIQGALRSRTREATVEGARLASFSAGPYSESYISPTAQIEAKQLDPDPEIAALMWAIATDSKKGEWKALWGGYDAPASAIQQIPWGLAGRLRSGY